MNQEREERIYDEIIVDCYGEEEVIYGWYNYLCDSLIFPFRAICIKERAISPLKINDEVTVIGMGPDEECNFEMFVMIQWDKNNKLAIPLLQIRSLDKESINCQAIEDWHYWKK